MSSPERIYSNSIRTLSFIFVALGLLILASTLAHGGGPLSLGTLLGLAFLAVGIARLWLSGLFRGWRAGREGSDG
jgi:vacuolar-type H+-ATPase subunit I/STV1